jgi:hypothetical protein
MLRGRFASSFALIGDAEYQAGLAQAERTCRRPSSPT